MTNKGPSHISTPKDRTYEIKENRRETESEIKNCKLSLKEGDMDAREGNNKYSL